MLGNLVLFTMFTFDKNLPMKSSTSLLLFFVLFLSHTYSQNVKLISNSFNNSADGGNLKYQFLSPVFERDSVSSEAFFVRLRVHSNQLSSHGGLLVLHELLLGPELIYADSKKEKGVLNYKVFKKDLPLVPGRYFVSSELYSINAPDSLWSKSYIYITVPEYSLVDFTINSLSIVDKEWDFPGDAMPFFGLFTRNSSSGKGYPDPVLSLYGKNENYIQYSLGTNVLEVQNQNFSFFAKHGDRINLQVKDWDALTKNDDIFSKNNIFEINKALVSGGFRWTSDNVHNFDVTYKIYDRPVFSDVKWHIEKLADTSRFMKINFVLSATKSEFPLQRLGLFLGTKLNSNLYGFMSDTVQYEPALQAYVAGVQVPILEVLGSSMFKLKLADKSGELSLYQGLIDASLLNENAKFNWVQNSIISKRELAQSIEFTWDNTLPLFLRAEKVSTEIILVSKDTLKVKKLHALCKQIETQDNVIYRMDLSQIQKENIPTDLKVVCKKFIHKNSKKLEIGSTEEAIELHNFKSVLELNLHVDGRLEKGPTYKVKLKVGDTIISEGALLKATRHKKGYELDMKNLKGMFKENDHLEMSIWKGNELISLQSILINSLENSALYHVKSEKGKKQKWNIVGKIH